jgi:hypothetical protein
MMKKILLLVGIGATMLTACSRSNIPGTEAGKLPNTVVLQWNEIAFKAFGGPLYQHSLMASRINAMMHLAMHDAINAVYPVYRTYAFTGIDKKADIIAAAVSAAHTVLVNEIPASKVFLDSALNVNLEAIKDSEAKQKGIALGKQAAQAILALRATDGAGADPVGLIEPSQTPGVYNVVPPFNFIFAPFWENVKPFGLQTKNQFRSVAPPALNSQVYTTDFLEVKNRGSLTSTTRTADETAYAKFWYEFSEAGWNRVARVAATNEKLNLFEAARLFALVDMAMADAYIAGWDSKLHYNFWRPYTAIRAAANDGNDATSADQAWEPSEPTPPIQDYPSTHSALGNAGATVLAKLLGNNTPFSMTSFTAVPQGATRTFASFSQAADENASSRVMAGIHFRFSCTAGQQMGTKIGNWVVDNYLQPK